jgi:hypothetical protein
VAKPPLLSYQSPRLTQSRIKLLRAKDEKRWQQLSRLAVYESDPKKLSLILKKTAALLKGKKTDRADRHFVETAQISV